MEGRADTPSALPNSLPRRGWIGAKETLANEDHKVKCLYLPATWVERGLRSVCLDFSPQEGALLVEREAEVRGAFAPHLGTLGGDPLGGCPVHCHGIAGMSAPLEQGCLFGSRIPKT